MEQNFNPAKSAVSADNALKQNRIILFANQKGGAGKTTLCALFANYLVKLGVPVAVLDADPQQTFYRRRQKDQRHVGEGVKAPYNVQGITISSRQSTRGILTYARSLKGTTIIDSPGSLTQEGMLELLPNCDFIVCPYHYDLNTVDSTSRFLSLVVRILQATKVHAPGIIFVSNNNDKRIGTKDELPTWKATDKYFSKFGKIAPRVDHYADIQNRYSTYDNDNVDEMHYKACFDYLLKEIYGVEDDE